MNNTDTDFIAKLHELVKAYPNDYDLGIAIRKMVQDELIKNNS